MQTPTTPPEGDALARNAATVRARIAEAASRANRDPADVTIMAVTKTIPVERILSAVALGFTVVGENRVQEASAKQDELRALANPPQIRWELIGHLQSNKAAVAVARFARIQSVDSLRLAEELARRVAQRAQAGDAARGEPGAHASGGQADAFEPLPILLEVNVAGEASKSGLAPNEVIDVARAIAALPQLRPEGLMTVAPLVDDAEDVRPVFRRLRELRDHLRASVPLAGGAGWRELSMGMTDDYAIAVEEGATILRIGRGLFGARPLA